MHSPYTPPAPKTRPPTWPWPWNSNREIGVAIGIIMATSRLTRADVFGLLRIASQHANRKLIDIAIEVGDTDELTMPPNVGDTRLLPSKTAVMRGPGVAHGRQKAY